MLSIASVFGHFRPIADTRFSDRKNPGNLPYHSKACARPGDVKKFSNSTPILYNCKKCLLRWVAVGNLRSMLASKNKGYFIDVSRYGVVFAETTSLQTPLRIDALRELEGGLTGSAWQELLQSIFGKRKNAYLPVRCGIYPRNRFIHRHTVENPAKLKDAHFATDLLQQQLKKDPSKIAATLINATDGSDVDPANLSTPVKDFLLCGAPHDQLATYQNELVAAAIYPLRMELGTLSALAALLNYLRWKEHPDPIMLLEVDSEASNVIILSKEGVEVSKQIPHGINSMFPLIKAELGLADEESARRLFYSNTFDFTEMGAVLLKQILRELQATAGSFELHMGQNISHLFVSQIPRNLLWLQGVLCKQLGLLSLEPDYIGWLGSAGITGGSDVQLEGLDNRYFGLLSLMFEH